MKLHYSERTRDDFREIYAFVLHQGRPESAEKLITALVLACERLIEFPQLGTVREELSRPSIEIRAIPESNHLIFYGIEGQVVHVVRIIHGSRQPKWIVHQTLDELDY